MSLQHRSRLPQEHIVENCRTILATLRRANPARAQQFRMGAVKMSILFDIDGQTSAILYSAGIDGHFRSCRGANGNYPVIKRRKPVD